MSEGVVCICKYCGTEWLPKVKYYGYMAVSGDDKCPRCGDKNIEKKRFEKIDYYSGTFDKEKKK
jgi:hypothetical protein